ncbi:MAG: lipopolysaccharide heptosyltransferase II [Rhodocyclaceae bacterium]|nr:lipopolysaccharide heptosyltransferase II [Rhodocyclaceae bacterium]
MKILIVAPSWIGDAVMTQPLLARLAAMSPALEIHVLAPQWCAPLFVRMPEVKRVLANPFGHGVFDLAGRWAFARGLRDERFLRAYVLPNSWKSALIPFFAGIPERIGYRGEARYILLNRVLPNSRLPRLVDRYLALAGPLPDETPRPHLVSTHAQQQQTRRLLGLSPPTEPIVFCPGAEYGPAKRWPAAHFAALARLVGERLQRPVWLLGSAKDAPVGAEIARMAQEYVTDLTGRTTLSQAIDLLAGAWAVVTNDSGLMHVAAALDRRLVALFGSSSPAFTPPLSPHAKIVSLGLPCSPCFQRTCPLPGKAQLACLTGITPTEVFSHLCQ